MHHHFVDVIAAELAVGQRVRREVATFPASPQLTAVLDALLGIEPRRTEPAFGELGACDDLIFARALLRRDFEYFIGHRDAVAAKLRDVANYLELGRGERLFLLQRLQSIAQVTSTDD
jgi:hypothetical protein